MAEWQWRSVDAARREKRIKTWQSTLTPWREVIAPHPDVQTGRYQQAEFAADLAQVLAGTATAEYGDPVEFFRRTYLTSGMRRLLLDALARLRGKGGEPVIQLKTAFGGGKTHTMLALYHLLRAPSAVRTGAGRGGPAAARPGDAPAAHGWPCWSGPRSIRSAPRAPWRGSEVNTLWGEMAWQLAGFKGFELVAAPTMRAPRRAATRWWSCSSWPGRASSWWTSWSPTCATSATPEASRALAPSTPTSPSCRT